MGRKILLPSISYVVARSYPANIIGCDNELPWHLKSDLKRFREITSDHAIIMGRKTYQSIGRPLPNRKNIVISRNDFPTNENIIQAKSIENALFMADYHSILMQKTDFFVIGGSQIYKLFHELFNKIYLTEVFSDEIKGDAKFSYKIDGRKWKLIEEVEVPKSDVDQYPSRYTTWEKKEKTKREGDISNFLTFDPNIKNWLSRYEENFNNKPHTADPSDHEEFEQLPLAI